MKTSFFSLALSLSFLGSINVSAFANPINSNVNQNNSSPEIQLTNLKQRLAEMEKRLLGSQTNNSVSRLENSSTSSVSSSVNKNSGKINQVNSVYTSITSSNNSSTKNITISSSTAILISFPNNLVVDVGQGDDYPITLPLFQDIRSASGEVLIPANTPVSLRVKPHGDGAIIVTDSIIVNGQIVSLDARSTTIPGRTITRTTAQQMARQNSAVVGNLFTSLSGTAGSSVSTQQQLGFLGAGIGIVSGLTAPDNVRVVEIPAGAVHVLKIN